jgi:hypothetical protein
MLKDIVVLNGGQRAESKDAIVPIPADDVVEDMCEAGLPESNATLSVPNERVVMDRRGTLRPHYVDTTLRSGDDGIANHGGCVVDENAIRPAPDLETAHYDIVGFDPQEFPVSVP